MVVNKEKAKKVIQYVVETTKTRWIQYKEKYTDLDELFIRRGYEQGWFQCWKFFEVLRDRDISGIAELGEVLDNFEGSLIYNREFAGNLESPFYQNLKVGKYGKIGKQFFESVEQTIAAKFSKGFIFYKLLWYMLRSCKILRDNYRSSFKFFLIKKYSEYENISTISDYSLQNLTLEEWSKFKKTKPWNKLPGIGENVFDFIVGDVIEFKFASESFKLDSANEYFLKITGINKLIKNNGKDKEYIINFLKSLDLNFTLRENNKGIYTYCSLTETENFGFCRSLEKCKECGINNICEKNFQIDK